MLSRAVVWNWNVMKLDLVDISVEPREYVVDDCSWIPAEDDFTVKSFTSTVKVFRRDDSVIQVDGRLSSAIEAQCDRCGRLFTDEVQGSFIYKVIAGEDSSLSVQEREVRDEDIELYYLQGMTLDLAEMLREQLVLTMPEKRLCDQECKGLCVRCGAKLNTEKCGCELEQSDSPFAILKSLKK